MIWSGLKGYLQGSAAFAQQPQRPAVTVQRKTHSATLQASRDSSARRMLRSDDMAEARGRVRYEARGARRSSGARGRTNARRELGWQRDFFLVRHVLQHVADFRLGRRRHAHGQRA